MSYEDLLDNDAEPFFSDPNWHFIDTPQTFITGDDDDKEQLSVLHVDDDKTDDEVKAWVERNYPETWCQHTYDCCGRYYANKARWWRVPYANRLIVHQTFRQNI